MPVHKLSWPSGLGKAVFGPVKGPRTKISLFSTHWTDSSAWVKYSVAESRSRVPSRGRVIMEQRPRGRDVRLGNVVRRCLGR